MGKTTLYHPISLHVIRGAAEYCGWKFGTIKQLYNEPDRGRARYRVEIVDMPKEAAGKSSTHQLFILAECFMNDIRPHWLRMTKEDVLLVDLQVDLANFAQSPDELQHESDQRGGN